jgi:hypothetical protein
MKPDSQMMNGKAFKQALVHYTEILEVRAPNRGQALLREPFFALLFEPRMPASLPAQVTPQYSALLLVDGHESHLNLEALEWAQQQGWEIMTFPSNCTHFMQPLDQVGYGTTCKQRRQQQRQQQRRRRSGSSSGSSSSGGGSSSSSPLTFPLAACCPRCLGPSRPPTERCWRSGSATQPLGATTSASTSLTGWASLTQVSTAAWERGGKLSASEGARRSITFAAQLAQTLP